MKVIVAGSRTVINIMEVRQALASAGYYPEDITEIVSGGARGVDLLGEEVAHLFGIKVARFPADWNTHGKSAGYKRNAEMAKYADALVAVWDGRSKGTKHMIDLMARENKPGYVHAVTGSFI